MKRKVLSLLLVVAMSVSMLAGCGGSDKDTGKGQNTENDSNANQDTENNDANSEKEEIDTSIYSEKVELRTDGDGKKKVVAYYDPTVVECHAMEDEDGKPYVDLGEMWNIYVTHVATVEDFMNYIISEMGGEIGKHEEKTLSGYSVHYFTIVEPGTGAFWDKIYVLELDGGVALNFRLMGSMEEGSQLEKELAAIKFVVE